MARGPESNRRALSGWNKYLTFQAANARGTTLAYPHIWKSARTAARWPSMKRDGKPKW
jgi:hypothetical protein